MLISERMFEISAIIKRVKLIHEVMLWVHGINQEPDTGKTLLISRAEPDIQEPRTVKPTWLGEPDIQEPSTVKLTW